MNYPESDLREIRLLDEWHVAILKSDSILELKDIRDRAEAIRAYAKAAAKDLEIQNRAAETRILAERKVGQLLSGMPLHGGRRHAMSSTHDEYLRLEKMGITRNQSRRWQMLARVPDDVFATYLRHCRDHQEEVTNAGLHKFAKACSCERELAPVLDRSPLTGVCRQLSRLITDGARFECICAFPPWPPIRQCGRDVSQQGARQRLGAELTALPLANVAAPNCHLHVWSPSERLWDAMRLCAAWGFAYRHILVCHRAAPRFGPYWRGTQDFLVLATKGNHSFRNSAIPSTLDLGEGEPSEQQRKVLATVEQVSSGPYLAILAVGSAPGWVMVSG